MNWPGHRPAQRGPIRSDLAGISTPDNQLLPDVHLGLGDEVHEGRLGRRLAPLQLDLAHALAGPLEDAGGVRRVCALEEAHGGAGAIGGDGGEGGGADAGGGLVVMDQFHNIQPAGADALEPMQRETADCIVAGLEPGGDAFQARVGARRGGCAGRGGVGRHGVHSPVARRTTLK